MWLYRTYFDYNLRIWRDRIIPREVPNTSVGHESMRAVRPLRNIWWRNKTVSELRKMELMSSCEQGGFLELAAILKGRRKHEIKISNCSTYSSSASTIRNTKLINNKMIWIIYLFMFFISPVSLPHTLSVRRFDIIFHNLFPASSEMLFIVWNTKHENRLSPAQPTSEETLNFLNLGYIRVLIIITLVLLARKFSHFHFTNIFYFLKPVEWTQLLLR